MNATRSAPASRKASCRIAGCRWVPSLISSTVIRSSSSRAAIGPGVRWPRPGIALKRWVATVAPASMASRVGVVGGVGVADGGDHAGVGEQPYGVKAAGQFGGDGHHPGGAVGGVDELAYVRRVRVAQQPGWWAPQRCGEMNGPSKWMPTSSSCWTSSASSRGLPGQVGEVAGDGGGDHGGGAVPAVGGGDRQAFLGVPRRRSRRRRRGRARRRSRGR